MIRLYDFLLDRTVDSFVHGCALIYVTDPRKFSSDYFEFAKFWTAQSVYEPDFDVFLEIFKRLLPEAERVAKRELERRKVFSNKNETVDLYF